MKKGAKILFWLVIIGGIVSVSLVFHNTVGERDYVIIDAEAGE